MVDRVRKVPRDAHDHRAQTARIATKVDDDPIEVTIRVYRGIDLPYQGSHPHVEPDVPRRDTMIVRLDAPMSRTGKEGWQIPNLDGLARIPTTRELENHGSIGVVQKPNTAPRPRLAREAAGDDPCDPELDRHATLPRLEPGQ